MKTIHMRIKSKYLNEIINGSKKYDCFFFDLSFKNLNLLDTVVYTDEK